MTKVAIDPQVELNSKLEAVLGSAKLATFWFEIPNRLLGNHLPSDYLKLGYTYKDLLDIVTEALEEGKFE